MKRLGVLRSILIGVGMLAVISSVNHPSAWSQEANEKSQMQEAESPDDYSRGRAADDAVQSEQPEQEGREIVYQKQVMLSEGELSNRIRKASEILSKATEEPDPVLSKALLNEAQCIAVFPKIRTAAAVIGGYHGDGIVTCKGPEGRYSALGFVDLTGGSIGAQLGVKTSDLILLFMSERARTAIEEGRIEMGVDMNVAFGGGKELREVDADRADVHAFSSSAGLFAGANLRGTSIGADEADLRKFYAENAAYERVITTYDIPNHPLVVRDFIKLMSEEELEKQLERR